VFVTSNLASFSAIFTKNYNFELFFQIAMKSGVIQRWGLVEFSTSAEAERTHQLLNGHLINGKPIRVQVKTGLEPV
jgi:hypothetical protein